MDFFCPSALVLVELINRKFFLRTILGFSLFWFHLITCMFSSLDVPKPAILELSHNVNHALVVSLFKTTWPSIHNLTAFLWK